MEKFSGVKVKDKTYEIWASRSEVQQISYSVTETAGQINENVQRLADSIDGIFNQYDENIAAQLRTIIGEEEENGL